MHKQTTDLLTRSAMLLCLALIFQSIRLIIPMPTFIAVFVIGVLVNAVLVLGCYEVGLKHTLIFSAVLPFVAYMQGQIPIPLFIPLILVGNAVYIVAVYMMRGYSLRIYSAALLKTIVIYGGVILITQFIVLPAALQKTFAITFGVAQIFTGCMGIFLAQATKKILDKGRK